ncbi:MAG: hypothetical protein NVSMB65_02780 [Chloroflexota bacterium]
MARLLRALSPAAVVARLRAVQRDPAWQLALWLLGTLRLSLALCGVVAARLQRPPVKPGAMVLIQGDTLGAQLLSVWQRWDARWYQQLAEHGYHAGDRSVAFSPLYPLLSRDVSLLLGGNVVLAQLVVTSAAFSVAMALLYHMARRDAGPVAARLAVLLTAFFPSGFFLLAPYTESLFLALTLAALWYARRGRPWAAGCAGLAATLTHTPGVLLVPALAFAYVSRRREQGRSALGWALPAAALPALGVVAFTLYERLLIGAPRTDLSIQAAWGYRVVPPWQLLAASWTFIARTGHPVEALNLACLVGCTLLAIGATRRLPPVYAFYVWPYLALLWTRQMHTSPLMSDSRLTLVLFPCMIMLALWLSRHPWLAAGWLIVGGLLQAVLFQYYVQWVFVA